jgi:hypothetical protein
MQVLIVIVAILFILLLILEKFDGRMNLQSYNMNNKSNFDTNDKRIIGYIHVCQKGEWRRSYDMLMSKIKNTGLYENVKEIRLGVVSENAQLIEDPRFNDEKVRVIYTGNVNEYERPTLLHMKKSSREDPDNTVYFYLHTKGIRWFGTKHESKVVEWIESMLDCNIANWENAFKILDTNETYGCNYNGGHYAGNFWWATAKHIQKLSDTIPEYYTAPEDWVLTNKDNMYCHNNCGEKFTSPYDPEMYK